MNYDVKVELLIFNRFTREKLKIVCYNLKQAQSIIKNLKRYNKEWTIVSNSGYNTYEEYCFANGVKVW